MWEQSAELVNDQAVLIGLQHLTGSVAARSIHVPPESAEETNAAGGITARRSSLPLQREEGIEGQNLEERVTALEVALAKYLVDPEMAKNADSGKAMQPPKRRKALLNLPRSGKTVGAYGG
ncbi:hypothetical protein ACFXOD_28870 [Streptomyces sp. NPDC059161]|uniref:hypothetical protein n=1 Tax=Streptomyces sp. NPDC059161 TaxID=3346749 RepID=UPI0036785C69